MVDGDSPLDVAGGKKRFECQVLCRHSQGINVYGLLGRDDAARLAFMRIYGCKCGYCGVSERLEPLAGFQVDHFIPQSKGGSDELENLVASCRRCNNLKRAFCPSSSDSASALHPDNSPHGVYVRGDDYRIEVSDAFSSDCDATDLYAKLRLGADSLRLDYLLDSLLVLVDDVLYKKAESGAIDWEVHSKCAHAAEVLRNRRNETFARV